MKARVLRKRPGRKPKKTSALPRRPTCRDCPFRAPSGACLDPVLTSGRCGDYVRYVVGNKQRRRLYVKPANPRTSRQRRGRARFGAASRKYSHLLTDEQRDACIAAGAKLRSRPRLGQSGPLTGQQYSIRQEYAAHAEPRKQKTAQTAKVPQWQGVTQKYRSQLPQPQRFTQSTPVTRRGASGMPPGHSRRDTGRGSRHGGRRRNTGFRQRNDRPGAAVRQSQRVTRFTRERYRGGRWASPNIPLPPATYRARGRSPSLRRFPWRGRAGGLETVWRRQRGAVGRGRGPRERDAAVRAAIR
jgi:hypothetical protein